MSFKITVKFVNIEQRNLTENDLCEDIKKLIYYPNGEFRN